MTAVFNRLIHINLQKQATGSVIRISIPILLKTTVGEIDVELWSKEAPKACRNFTQLCMEGYYNGTIFHRVIPNFIVQGGDPTGTGTGGESIYGKTFKDEFHSRLRFVRRGLVCMANAGPHDNGSQFFFTLGATPELNNKHTIFGKVTGNTVYNMLKLAECDIGEDDRPLYPHKVLRSTVLDNAFDDIVPRVQKDNKDKAAKKAKKEATSKATKNFQLLSFGEEAEEDEEEVTKATEVMKTKGKSSHDLLKDKQLSSKPALDVEYNVKRPHLEIQEDSEEEEEDPEAVKESIRKKLKKQHDTDAGPPDKAKLDKKETSMKMETNELKTDAQDLDKYSPDKSKDSKRSKSHSREKEQPDSKSRADDKRTDSKSDSSSSHKDRHKRDVDKSAQSDSVRLASKDASPAHRHSPNHKASPNHHSREKEDRQERDERKDKSRKKDKSHSKEQDTAEDTTQDSNKIEELQKEARELRKELAKMKQKEKEKTQQPTEEPEKQSTTNDAEEEPPKELDPDLVSSFKAERKKYKEVRAKQAKKGSAREEATLAILAKFKTHLNTAQEMFGETEEGEVLDEEEDADKQDPSTYRWLSHKLKFDDSEQAQKVKDANVEELDRYEIFDPRNPINKRRREQSKAIMKNKR